MMVPLSSISQKQHPQRGSRARSLLEATGGVVAAGAQVAASLLPSVVVGAVEGQRRARQPEIQADPDRLARQLVLGTAAKALVPSAILGYTFGGLQGAAVSLAGQGASTAAGIALLARGGSANLIAEGLATDLDRSLEGETSITLGVLKGIGTGFTSGVVHNARAGFREGQGITSGLIEGVKELPEAFRGGSDTVLSGNWLQKAGQVVAATAGCLLAAPAGVVQGLVATLGGERELSLTGRTLISAASLAAVAASWPLTLGMLGTALTAAGVAAGVGAVSSLVGGKKSLQRVSQAVDGAAQNNKQMDHPISQKRQQMLEGALVGGAAAAGAGWDRAAGWLGATQGLT